MLRTRHTRLRIFTTTLMVAGLALPAAAGDKMDADATAELKTGKGKDVGTAWIKEAPGGVLIKLKLHDLPDGKHAFHIHETGSCSPMDDKATDTRKTFSDAGSHLASSGRDHGLLDEARPHEGDMPNIATTSGGKVEMKIFNDGVSLHGSDDSMDRAVLLDRDGAALVVHEGADDYRSDPSGDAGGRLACGVIKEN